MTTMLEKMAEAMRGELIENYEFDEADLDRAAKSAARAALLAIREPSQGEMIQALRDNSALRANIARQEFTAMIDAILAEEPETAVRPAAVVEKVPAQATIPKGGERPKVGARARVQEGESVALYVITDVEDWGGGWRLTMRPEAP